MSSGISDKIKYDFNQLSLGLISMIANLEAKLHEIYPDLPVGVLQTGDSSYFLLEKFEETKNKEIYQKVPRFILEFQDIAYNSDENTNQYNKIYFKRDDKIYTCTARRLAVTIPIYGDFVSSNFVKASENFEIMSTIVARQNVFTYEFMGNTYEGAYNMTSNTNEKPGMDIGSGTRNTTAKTYFDVQLHLMVPRIETIQEYLGPDKIVFNLKTNGEVMSEEKINYDFLIDSKQ